MELNRPAMFLRSVLLCGLYALALAGPPTEPSTDSYVKLERGSCPLYWYSYGTECYRYVASRLPWAEAELSCRNWNANLVSIHHPDEMSFITSLIENFDSSKPDHWIGFSDLHKEGWWMWSDGAQTEFADWNENQPDNQLGGEHCAHITFNGKPAGWEDVSCTKVSSFVCKARVNCRYGL
ncbi:unnamed protein product [Boreogadus saida]